MENLKIVLERFKMEPMNISVGASFYWSVFGPPCKFEQNDEI